MRKPFLLLALMTTLACSNEKEKPTESPIVTGYTNTGALDMYYEIHGTSEDIPLVLIHGGGSTIGTNWSAMIPLLSRSRKVIAVELQAHGHTRDVERPESFEQDADDVATALLQLKVAKADLFGFSNGGNTAMQVAMRHPEVVNKLVLASTFYKREGMVTGFWEQMGGASLSNMPAPLQKAFLAINPDSSALRSMHDKDAARMVGFNDWTDDMLKSIKGPALIIVGDQDIVTAEHAATMSRLIPSGRLMIVPGNHGSYLGEVCSVVPDSKTSEMVAGMIEEFLDKK